MAHWLKITVLEVKIIIKSLVMIYIFFLIVKYTVLMYDKLASFFSIIKHKKQLYIGNISADSLMEKPKTLLLKIKLSFIKPFFLCLTCIHNYLEYSVHIIVAIIIYCWQIVILHMLSYFFFFSFVRAIICTIIILIIYNLNFIFS